MGEIEEPKEREREGGVTCLRSIGESEIKKGFLEEVAFETDSEERLRF